MDMTTIIGAFGSIAAMAVSAYGVLQWIGNYKKQLVEAQAVLQAVRAGADGLISILTEVIGASDKNTLQASDVQQIIASASDIPSAIKTALRVTAVSTPPATPQ